LSRRPPIGSTGAAAPQGIEGRTPAWLARLSRRAPSAHTRKMAKDHPFSIKVLPDPEREGRFRWTIYESGKQRDRSRVSFAARSEAESDAITVMQKCIAKWWTDE
jgi:hypothetical protein